MVVMSLGLEKSETTKVIPQSSRSLVCVWCSVYAEEGNVCVCLRIFRSLFIFPENLELWVQLFVVLAIEMLG